MLSLTEMKILESEIMQKHIHFLLVLELFFTQSSDYSPLFVIVNTTSHSKKTFSKFMFAGSPKLRLGYFSVKVALINFLVISEMVQSVV